MTDEKLPKHPDAPYFGNLDGMRSICFLMVFFFHSFAASDPGILGSETYIFVKTGIFRNGNLGVNCFFVLSGFLITYLLIREKANRSSVNIPSFWIRRVLRIWPLYFFCVFFGFVIFPQIKLLFGQSPHEPAHLINFLTFTSNFDYIATGSPDSSVLSVLWSVAIEEQFYLVWPVLIAVVPFKYLWLLFAALIVFSLGFRITHNDYANLEYHSFSCIGDLVTGSLAAWLVMRFEGFKERIAGQKWFVYTVPYLLFAVYFIWKDSLTDSYPQLHPYDRLVSAVLIAWIVLDQSFNVHSPLRLSRFRLLTKGGKYTYGMYCLHFIGILVAVTLTKQVLHFESLPGVMIVEPAVSLLITIAVSWASYHWFELYFLRLKQKFAR
jgi:peptidoglycan/LPS O-acetylase OafA/YrhL